MKNHTILNFSVFICALVIGFSFSNRFYHPGALSVGFIRSAAAAENQQSIATLGNGQRSILIITASGLSKSNPLLKSIWLASYLPGEANILWLPIYRSDKSTSSDFGQQLNQAFKLSKQNRMVMLSQTFLDLLKQHNYWWSGYIVMDELALEGISAEVSERYGANSGESMILLSVCQGLSGSSTEDVSGELITFITENAVTDLDPELIRQELGLLLSGKQALHCSFPAAQANETH